MKEFECEFKPDMPEQSVVSFVSTGSKGGDAGHGGYASLILSENGSRMNLQADLTIVDGRKISFQDIKDIRLTVSGDWELEGLAIALMDIGRKLLSRDDVINDYSKWQLQED